MLRLRRLDAAGRLLGTNELSEEVLQQALGNSYAILHLLDEGAQLGLQLGNLVILLLLHLALFCLLLRRLHRALLHHELTLVKCL